jgi:general secretion pathway protein H
MMPISAPPTKPTACGFTLIELLAVLAVMAIVAYGAAGMIGRKPDTSERVRLEAKLMTALQAARQDALEGGRIVKFDPANMVPNGKQFAYRPSVGKTAALLFYPDGSSSGGDILLNGKVLLAIDWLTGKANDAS